MSVISGGQKFYSPLIFVISGVLMIFIVLRKFEFVKPKILNIILVSFLAICALVITGYEINKAYVNSIATVNEQGVDLEIYKPFNNTKVVRLQTINIKNSNKFT